MKKIIYILLLLLTIVSCKQEKVKIKPELTDMTVSVYASVVIQPKGLYNINPEASGVIEALVSKNQIIAKIKNENTNYDVSTAKLNKGLAQEFLKGKSNRLSSLESDIKNLQNQLTLDSLNYSRQKTLWQDKIGSKVDLENRKLKFDLSIEKLKASKKVYQQTKLELENNYRISENNLNKSKSVLNNFTITSLSDGKIYKLSKTKGESTGPQEVFAQIGSATDFIIEMQIDEVDITSIQLNQDIIIALDAFPNKTFEARIFKIYPSKDIRTQTFKVEGIFKNPPKSLYAGLSGEANIISSQHKNILTIPIEFLTVDNNVLLDNGKELQVDLGLRNLSSVEVLSGIDSSTVLIKPSQQ